MARGGAAYAHEKHTQFWTSKKSVGQEKYAWQVTSFQPRTCEIVERTLNQSQQSWIYCLPPALPPLVAVRHCTPWNFLKRLFLSSLWYCLALLSCQWGRRPRAQRLRTGSWLAAKGTEPPCTLLLPLTNRDCSFWCWDWAAPWAQQAPNRSLSSF